MERAGAEDMGDEVERKGLGTPATRADIIEKLVKDGFVKREKKQMIPAEDGMKLITILPDVVKGKFGAYCTGKCGMNVGKALGGTLSDAQVKSLLQGKKMLVKGLKGKKGSYDAYLIPQSIEEFSYMKDGRKIKGFQYKFKMEFPPKKDK